MLIVSRDQLPYITIAWSTDVYHEKYTAPCYPVEYANSDNIMSFSWLEPKDKAYGPNVMDTE